MNCVILIYYITASIVFGKAVLKIMSGPQCKQSKNIEKSSEKSGGIQMKEPNF